MSLLFFGFIKRNKLRSCFFSIWKKTLWRKIHLHIALSQYTFSSDFTEFIDNVFPLHTHPYAHTNTYINFHLLWHWTSSTRDHILFFLVAFIKHMQYKKSSSLLDINNFSKTKGLSGNKALNKNLSNGKRQKATSIQFRAEKIFFQRRLAIEWHKVVKIFPDKVT